MLSGGIEVLKEMRNEILPRITETSKSNVRAIWQSHFESNLERLNVSWLWKFHLMSELRISNLAKSKIQKLRFHIFQCQLTIVSNVKKFLKIQCNWKIWNFSEWWKRKFSPKRRKNLKIRTSHCSVPADTWNSFERNVEKIRVSWHWII